MHDSNSHDVSHRQLKDDLYAQFARVGKALASPVRLEILDLLAQGERHVEAIADQMDTPTASVSQHLQVLRNAALVEGERDGTRVIYRLSDRRVLHLWLTLRAVAESRLAEVERAVRGSDLLRMDGELVPREDVQRRLESGELVVLDVRPPLEYEAGHLSGAMSFPLETLHQRLEEVPQDRDVVVYCRGAYCAFAVEAIELLRKHGIAASRLEGGWQEWVDEGRPVARVDSAD